jgi:hypothetical protein
LSLVWASIVGVLLAGAGCGLFGSNPAGAPALRMPFRADEIEGMAVYDRKGKRQELDLSDPRKIAFNVTGTAEIARLVAQVDFTTRLDVSRLLYDKLGLVFVRFKDGSVVSYEVFGSWDVICQKGRYAEGAPIRPAGRELWARAAQE